MSIAIDRPPPPVDHRLGLAYPAVKETAAPGDSAGQNPERDPVLESSANDLQAVEDTSVSAQPATAERTTPVEQVLTNGHRNGNSMGYLVEFLEKNHPNLFKRLQASEAADLSVLTDEQLAALAKRMFVLDI